MLGPFFLVIKFTFRGKGRIKVVFEPGAEMSSCGPVCAFQTSNKMRLASLGYFDLDDFYQI